MTTSATAFRRFGLLAAVALVLAQLVAVSHAVAADHQTGEACFVCLASDRTDDVGAPTADVAASLPSAPTAAATATAIVADDHRPTANQARGPPAL